MSSAAPVDVFFATRWRNGVWGSQLGITGFSITPTVADRNMDRAGLVI